MNYEGVTTMMSKFGDYLRASFWFLPTLMVAGAVAMAGLLIGVDARVGAKLQERYPQLFDVTAQGARDLLTAIASSMITVAGVTFSITIVTLSLASSQYTSRALRNFLRDRGNQTVLGVFVAIFAYCLVVLFAIRDTAEHSFVPPLSVLVGIVLAFFGIGFLIYFIHHVAHSIQASTMIAETTQETLHAIDHLFPDGNEDEQEDFACILPPEVVTAKRWQPVAARTSGYLQDLDIKRMVRLAEEQNIVLRMERAVGDFLLEASPLVSILGATQVAEETVVRIHRALAVSNHRTIVKDPGFGIRQMVDVAMKALSPGVNDTTTANVCLDHLTVVLARLIQRRLAVPCRSTDGHLRMILQVPSFADLLGESFEQIRQNAAGNVRVLAHLLYSVQQIAPLTENPQRLLALQQQVELTAEVVDRTVAAPADRQRLLGECGRIADRLRVRLGIGG